MKIISTLCFVLLAYQVAADESSTEASRGTTLPFIKTSRKGNRGSNRVTIKSRSINYYNGAQQQQQQAAVAPSSSAALPKTHRDSSGYSQSSYVSVAPVANYAPAAAYTSSYSSYPSYTTYSEAPAYEEQFYYDDNKSKKVALAIALPLALTLGPLAVIGLIALFNLKAIFTIAVINALCNNTTFATNFSNLCTIINNIGKRSSSEETTNMIFKQIANTENMAKFVDFVNSAKFTLMDRLQGPAKH